MVEQPRSRIWRDRAEEYRIFAQTCTSPEARDGYMRVVASCEKIAERLERTEKKRGGGECPAP